MELVKMLGALLFILGIWLLFLTVLSWSGLSSCRAAAWWMPGQKVKGYVTISSRRLARLLISSYERYNGNLHTNSKGSPASWHVNQYPNRFSYFGILVWCILGPLSGWWAYEITRYFIFPFFADIEIGNGVPRAGISLGLCSLVMGLLTIWNSSKADGGPALTTEELQAIRKAEKQARKNEKRVRSQFPTKKIGK